MIHRHFHLFCLALFAMSVSGMQKDGGDEKIRGGRLAKEGEFPYLGLIAGGNACGCVLVTMSKVVTSAHCFVLTWSPKKEIDLSKTYVFAGSVKLADQEGGQMTQIKSYYIPKGYGPRGDGKMLSDISTAVLTKPFQPNDRVAAMKIVSSDPDDFKEAWDKVISSGKKCTSMGWGTSSVTFEDEKPVPGTPETFLKTTEIKPLTEAKCRKAQGPGKDIISDGFACFLGVKHGDMPLFGDSGSPLVCDGYVYGVATVVTFSKLYPEKPTPFFYVLFWKYFDELGIGAAVPFHAIGTSTFVMILVLSFIHVF